MESLRFDQRDHLRVYVLAQFDGKAPATVDPLDARVIYVGETNRRTPAKRWYQFHRSAAPGLGGYSRRHKYRRRYTRKVENLFVAVLPLDLEPPRLAAFIAAAERTVIRSFVAKNGSHPACNTKCPQRSA